MASGHSGKGIEFCLRPGLEIECLGVYTASEICMGKARLGITVVTQWMVSLLALPAMAAETPAPVPEVGDEVVVTAQPSLIELRMKISEAEDAMFALFNQLNTDDRYDMHCSWEIRNFSHIKVKQCLPEYAREAQREEALVFFTGVQRSPPVTFVLSTHNPVMAQKIEETARANPEFMQALIHHYELTEQYDYSRKRAFGRDDTKPGK